MKIDPSLPPELVAIIDKAMAKLRDERYADMIALRVDLETFRQQHQASVGPTTPVPVDYASGPTMIAGAPTIASGGVPRPASGAIASHGGRTIAVAAVALVLLAIAGVWFVGQKFSSAPAQAPAVTTAPSEDPIAKRLSAAQQALDARQFTAALRGADEVLRDAPQSADAQRIRDAARQGALTDALERGARHLGNGATREAIQAAGEALALAPDSAGSPAHSGGGADQRCGCRRGPGPNGRRALRCRNGGRCQTCGAGVQQGHAGAAGRRPLVQGKTLRRRRVSLLRGGRAVPECGVCGEDCCRRAGGRVAAGAGSRRPSRWCRHVHARGRAPSTPSDHCSGGPPAYNASRSACRVAAASPSDGSAARCRSQSAAIGD